jgi:uncharacterized protein YndB with AHSA1/START domain
MTQRTCQHSTVVLERSFKASPERVFAAWSDPRQRAQWEIPSADWVAGEFSLDFRVGGQEIQSFGPKGDPHIRGEGRILNIVPNARIISAGTMHDRGKPLSCTLATVEIYPEGTGSKLILTDQTAFFSWETPKDRESGCHEILNQLEKFLGGQ